MLTRRELLNNLALAAIASLAIPKNLKAPAPKIPEFRFQFEIPPPEEEDLLQYRYNHAMEDIMRKEDEVWLNIARGKVWQHAENLSL